MLPLAAPGLAGAAFPSVVHPPLHALLPSFHTQMPDLATPAGTRPEMGLLGQPAAHFSALVLPQCFPRN